MSKKVTVKKPKPIKPRNSQTMTESAFWSFIRSNLRKASRFWKPIQECKKNARRPYIGANKRQKYEYQCAECKQWFAEKDVSVDHIYPVGKLNSAADLPAFVENLFCEIDKLQVLCDKDHDAKTTKDKELIKNLKQQP